MNTFISTSIAYVNGKPHIGFALENIQADVYARYHKLIGDNTFFVTGTDENAIKNVEAAESAGQTPQEFVDELADSFIGLRDHLNLDYDRFIRTTEDTHRKGAQKLWSMCKSEDIYKKTYEGYYCVGCESFYKPEDLVDSICPMHNRKLELVKEENYFFALSKYQDKLIELIESDTLAIEPEYRKREILNFAKKGLEDFSISRPAERTKNWGIAVPNDDSQMMYVWFDALTNYITALGFAEDSELFSTFWNETSKRVHVIGKDILKFHALYWPAMLMSANLPLPTHIFSHGFINVEGKKMSKTLGNVIDPVELTKSFGTDAVRYFLLREIPGLDDGDYSTTRMHNLYNNDLSNELGNLVTRLTTLAEKDEITMPVPEKVEVPKSAFIEEFQFHVGLEQIWLKIKELNKATDTFAPWKKQAEERHEFLTDCLTSLHEIGVQLEPYIPNTAKTMQNAVTGNIKKAPPLFPRITQS